MQQKEMLDQFRAVVGEMLATVERKNKDYACAAGEKDAFANFFAAERLDVCCAEAGMLTRMLDKFMRINSFVKRGVLAVKDESVEDTCQDLAVYSILLLLVIRSRKVEAVASTRLGIVPGVRQYKAGDAIYDMTLQKCRDMTDDEARQMNETNSHPPLPATQ